MSTARLPQRYVVGWFASNGVPRLRPAGGRLLLATRACWLWAVGDWPAEQLRTVAHAGVSLTVFGACLADLSELEAILTGAAAVENPERVTELPGSFAAVLVAGDRVLVVPDLAGVHPVFHTSMAGTTVFASSALPLAALRGGPGVDQVDRSVLATRLFLPILLEAAGAATVWRGVRRVGGGQVLTITGAGGQVSELPSLPRLSATEGGQALRDGLLLGVRRRVRAARRPTVDLSGGLDSSTLAVLADRAGARPLAVTYTDPYAVNDDDVIVARAVAANCPGLEHVTVAGDAACLPFTDLAAEPAGDGPALEPLIAARTRRRLGPVVGHGSDLHLGGDGGDVVLTADLTYLADLARAGHLRRLWTEATGWARLRDQSALPVLRAAVRLAGTGWTASLSRLANQLDQPAAPVIARGGVECRLAWVDPSDVAAWGQAHARRAVACRLRVLADTPTTTRPDTATAAAWRAVRWHGAATRDYLTLAHRHGVAVDTPFLDNQVVRACLAVPPAERTTVTRVKPLLTTALADLLPRVLRDRRTKGNYTACEFHGIRANAPHLRRLLDRPLLAELNVLAPDGPRSALAAAIAGARAPLAALGAALAAEVWLRGLGELPRTWWEPNPRQATPVATEVARA